MEKRWVFKAEPDQKETDHLSKALQIPQKLASLLINRGIVSYEEAKTFFRPSLNDLHDPMMMKDMDQAVEAIQKAIENKQKILVYGDYDVDGTTSVAMMVTYLSQFDINLEYYIPDRYKEGYGVSDQGIDYAIDQKFDLIITLDCGIKAVDKIRRAKDAGIEVIVCDHHRPGAQLPEGIILDPVRADCIYPFKGLSGCGVGFKLIQALEIARSGDWLNCIELLDFVAISIGADIVPMVGENRILAHFGLEQINRPDARVGIEALIQVAKRDKPLTITDVVFTIAPRINAAGRLEDAKQAVALLIEADPIKAQRQAEWIDQNNERRKDLDKSITEEALQQILEDENHGIRSTSVVYHPDWNKGIVGIVASRLIEQHYRPTIVLTESEGKAVGSARSVNGYDVYEALDACSDFIEQFGGHKYAAGMTIDLAVLNDFKNKFEEVVKETIHPDLLIPHENIEMELRFDDIFEEGEFSWDIPKFYRILKQFAPFGPGNMKPLFVTRNVQDAGGTKIIGQTREHLRVNFIDTSGKEISGVAFGFAHLFEEIKNNAFDVAYTLEENTWHNKTTLQLNVKDIRMV